MKKIAFILLSMLLLFHLVSCGGDKDHEKHNYEPTTVRENAPAESDTETENNVCAHPEDNSPGIDLPIVPN